MRLKSLLALGTLFALNASAQLKVDSLGQTTTQQLTSTRIFVEDNAPDWDPGTGGPVMSSAQAALLGRYPHRKSNNKSKKLWARKAYKWQDCCKGCFDKNREWL